MANTTPVFASFYILYTVDMDYLVFNILVTGDTMGTWRKLTPVKYLTLCQSH